MTRRLTAGTLLLAATVFAPTFVAPLQAQAAPSVIGAWDIEYVRGENIENDVVTKIMGKGRMIIAASADSLIVKLVLPPRPDGTAVPIANFGGRVANGTATFTQQQEARLNMNGEEHVQKITSTWTLQASGDVLTGTLTRQLPMMDAPASTPVSGTRARP